MSNIILHIGALKTGTTALQNFLFQNRKVLRSQGVEYPVFSLPKADTKNGTFLRKYCELLLDGKDPKIFLDNFLLDWSLLEKSFRRKKQSLYLTRVFF